MPFIATLDLVINFDKFRNVDLLSQGLYSIGVSVATKNEELQGIPISMKYSSIHGREGQHTQKPSDNNPREELCPAEKKAYTHSFYIQYLEQIELLNEIVTFRLEADAMQLLRDDTLHVTLELFHLQRESMEAPGSSEPLSRSKMPLLESRVIPLHRCSAGMHTYLPVTFNQWDFGVVSCSFHTCLVDITYDAADPRCTKGGYQPARGSEEQYMEQLAPSGMTVQEAALALFRSLTSYPLNCFYDLRALVAEFTPDADQDLLEEPDWLHTIANAKVTPERCASDGYSPRVNRWRIVSGVDKQEVLDPFRGTVDAAKVLDPSASQSRQASPSSPADCSPTTIHPGNKGLQSPTSGSPIHPNVLTPSGRKSGPILLCHSIPVDPAGTSGCMSLRSTVDSGPTMGSFSEVGDHAPNGDPTCTSSGNDHPSARGYNRVPLLPSYDRPRPEITYCGEEEDLQLYPFGVKTVSTITEWLADDLTLEVNEATVAQLPSLISDRLAFVTKQIQRVWHQLLKRTLSSPASMFVGLAKVFFRAQRSLALRALEPTPVADSSAAAPVTIGTYFTYPHWSSVSLKEIPANVRRDGLGFVPLHREDDSAASAVSPLLRALDETICSADFKEGVHLVVFVHGFRGNRFDFRLFRNYMSVFLAAGRMDYLLCQSLEKIPYHTLGQMGEALAAEVQEHITSENIRIRKLSFVAHSMGAVVVRAALRHPLLDQYSPYFETYASFGAPHLGNTVVRSMVVDSAMWVLSALKHAGCIQQLKLADGFLHCLSCEDRLGKFRNVLLVSCDEDTFVATESAIALVTPEARRLSVSKDLKAQQVEDMARNFNQHLAQTDRCIRLRITSVEGNTSHCKQTMVERFTGKGHHVAFLCNVSFIVTFLALYKDFFA